MVGQSTMRTYCLLENTGDTYCYPNPQRFLVQDILRSVTQAFWTEVPSLSPMLEVISAVTGKSIAVFEDEEIADRSVKALKQRLAQKIGLPRFRQRILQDNCPLDNDQIFAMQVVQLVILEFQPPDTEQDRGVMMACSAKWWQTSRAAIEHPTQSEFSRCKSHHASVCGSLQRKSQMCTSTPWSWCQQRPRQDRHWINTSMHCSSPWASWSCPISGWVGCQQRPRHGQTVEQHLYALQLTMGILKLSDFWLSRVPTKTKAGQTMEQPLYSVQLTSGHLEVVRFLVESGANKDQGRQTLEQRLFAVQLRMGTLKLSDFWLSRVPTKTKARQTLDQRLFSLQLTVDTLKLSNFWLSRVPTKTRARQTLEQHLFSLQLSRGTLKLSDFWLSRVPTKTKARQTLD